MPKIKGGKKRERKREQGSKRGGNTRVHQKPRILSG